MVAGSARAANRTNPAPFGNVVPASTRVQTPILGGGTFNPLKRATNGSIDTLSSPSMRKA